MRESTGVFLLCEWNGAQAWIDCCEELSKMVSMIVLMRVLGFEPWLSGLASRRKCFDLGSTCVAFGYPLALICDDDLRRLLVELTFARKSTQVFRRLAT